MCMILMMRRWCCSSTHSMLLRLFRRQSIYTFYMFSFCSVSTLCCSGSQGTTKLKYFIFIQVSACSVRFLVVCVGAVARGALQQTSACCAGKSLCPLAWGGQRDLQRGKTLHWLVQFWKQTKRDRLVTTWSGGIALRFKLVFVSLHSSRLAH